MKKNKTIFMGLERKNNSLPLSNYIVVPIPFERSVSYGHGTAFGPKAVLEASAQVELWDEETKTETWKENIFTTAAVNCKGTTRIVFNRITKTVKDVMRYKGIPFYIGGEHSITQALLEPYIEKYKKLSVLHFDAHADLRAKFEGNPHSHACALYPASKQVPVVQVGIRSVGDTECENINSGKVKTFLMHENRDIKKLIPQVLKNLTDTVYITIDVDGFDPSVIPATGTPQPGGFGWYEALDLFREVINKKNIVAIDVVEACRRDEDTITEMNTAKLIYRLMGYLSQKKK
ncbi:Agmatinase [Elusimicrobium minutum Pei191]|uniref:Agmatinase n=1 Tax=Elusimicrobium minutum (strain Pei191) TaxID=445932 RepID=B2KEY9_ELUMP|nr:agmatinase [Elusimicrobium minutum]ACC99085.1 Agmatinase [Elusimicrobium minutum Pei191]